VGTIWFGFLLGIGMMLAVGVVALAPLLIRLAFFGCIALAIAVVAGVVLWSLWANPGLALAFALTFGWIPCLGLIYFGFDRFMVWLRNDPQRQRDFAHRLETDLHDAGYCLPRREPRLLPPSKK
jgi:site-specific recombinase